MALVGGGNVTVMLQHVKKCTSAVEGFLKNKQRLVKMAFIFFALLIKVDMYISKIFHTCNAIAFLAAELMVDLLGGCGLCVPCSVAILSAAAVEDDSFVRSLAGNGGMWLSFLYEITGGLGAWSKF